LGEFFGGALVLDLVGRISVSFSLGWWSPEQNNNNDNNNKLKIVTMELQ
jgi:hypothetical protein